MQSGEHFRTNSIFCSRVSRSLLDSATSGGFHISATRMEEVRRMTQFRKSCSRPSHGSYLTPMYEVLYYDLLSSCNCKHGSIHAWFPLVQGRFC